MPLPRRTLLFGGLAVALAGCGGSPAATPPSSTSPATVPDADLAALEQKFGGRLGFYALDTGSGRSVAYRTDERFLMCSTHKVLVVGAILQLRQQQPGLLDRVITYDKSQIRFRLDGSPDGSVRSNGVTQTVGFFLIGDSQSGGYSGFKGDLAALAVYEGAMSMNDLVKLESFINSQY